MAKITKARAAVISEFIDELGLVPKTLITKEVLEIIHKSWERELQAKNLSKAQKQEWLEKFYRRMSFALYKGFILPPATIIDDNSILKTDYSQPITTGGVNYKNI